MLRLGSPGANSTNPDKPKAAGDSGGRRGSHGFEQGWAGTCLTIPVTCPASRSACAGMRPRAQGPRAGVGCCGSHGGSAVSGRAGGWQGWCRPGSSSICREFGSSRAESSRCPCSIPGAAPSSGDAPGAASSADAFPRLQHLKRRLLASSAFPDCCFHAVISREMSSDAAGPSGHWQGEQQVPGPGAAQRTGPAGTPTRPGELFPELGCALGCLRWCPGLQLFVLPPAAIRILLCCSQSWGDGSRSAPEVLQPGLLLL